MTPEPWLTEPNREEWTDEATGFPCLILRHESGHLCGYVQVPSALGTLDEETIDCHGGINFGFARNGREWIGFDCGHIGDFQPNMPRPDTVYRDIAYVRAECAKVAGQLHRHAKERA